MVFEARIARALNRALGDRLHGLDKSNVRLSLLEGEVALQKVRVKSTALRGMKGIEANVKVKAGYVGELRIKIPWRELGKKPVEVTFDRLHVLCEFRRDDDDEDDDEEEFDDEKKAAATSENERNEMKRKLEEKREKKRKQINAKKRREAESLERRWLKGDPTPGAEELTQKFWGDITKEEELEENDQEQDEETDDDDISSDSSFDDDDDKFDTESEDDVKGEERVVASKRELFSSPDTRRREEMFATPEYQPPLQTPEIDIDGVASSRNEKVGSRNNAKKKSKKKKPVGFEALLDVVLANAVVTVKNIHFRFEGEGDENMPKFAVGASLESITLETTNVFGDSRAFVVDAFKETLRKKLEINNAAVYCDLNSVHLLDKVKNRDLKPHEDPIRFCKIMEACAKSKNRNRIIEPFAATARYERAGLEAIESGTASALHGLTLNIPKTSANVSAGAARLAYWATQILKKSMHDRRFEHLRPSVPVFDGPEKAKEELSEGMTRRTNKNAQLWWQYACEATIEENRKRRERLGTGFSFDSKTLKTLHEQRKAYVQVYIDEILEKSAPPPPPSWKQNANWPMKKPFGKIRKLDELESEIPNARMIAFFRQLAHIEWRGNGGCERAFRREAIRRGGGPIPVKIVKGAVGVAGKGLLVGVKVIKNVGFKPLGAAKRFATKFGKNQQERDEMDAMKKREIEDARIRAEEEEENLKEQIRKIRKKNAETPVKHLFGTPRRSLRNAPNDFDNRDAITSDDESQIDWDEVRETFDINARQEYAKKQNREMQNVEKKNKIPMFATYIAFEEISMKILDASSNERNDHDDAVLDSLAPSSSSSFSSFASMTIKGSELFNVSINNVVVGAKMMGKSFVKDAIDVRSTIDSIRFSAPEGDLLALGDEERDNYSSDSTRGMGFLLPIMLAKLFNADLNDAEDTITNGRPRCFSGSPVSKAVSFAVSKKRKVMNKNTEPSISLKNNSAATANPSSIKRESNAEVEKEVGYCALVLSPTFITILRGPIDRIVDVFTKRMKDGFTRSRLDTSTQIAPGLDAISRGSIETGSGVSSFGGLTLAKIGLAVFVGKVHLAIPSQRKDEKMKGTTLIARFGPLTARSLKSAQNAHVQEQDADARKSWRKRTIEGKLLDCSIGFADNFAWSCNQSWQLLEEAGERNRVETPVLSRVRCNILSSHYALSPREALKYSPVVVDVNLPSIQLSVSPERINMALRVATQFTESAKKIADEAKRIKEQKKKRSEFTTSQLDKAAKSDDDGDEKITFSSSLPSSSSLSSGHKYTDDIFTRDIDIFDCERLVAADLFGEPPRWESCDVFVREGTLSVVNKPAGSVHHLEPRVLKLAGTRGAGKPLTRTQEKVKVCIFSINERSKSLKVKLDVSADSDEIIRKMNSANREYSEYDRTLIVGDALLDRSIESNFEKMCEHPNGFVFRFASADICDVMKDRLNMEARLLPFHEEVRQVLKVDEHKTKKASVTFSMGLFGFHLGAPLRHHNHETDSYVNDMSKSYFIDKLAEDEKIKYVVDCFQERPLANVKITGLTLSCDATKGSVTLGAGLRRVAIKDCWTIEGIGKDHDAVFIEEPLRNELSTKYLRYKTDALKKSCVGFSLEAFLPPHPEYEKQVADLRMAVSSIETHVAREPIAAFTSFRFLFRSPVAVGKGWPSRYDDSVFAPSREEWENMREKLRKVKLLDASKLTHKIKLNFTFYGDSLVARLYDDPKKSALAANTRRQSILEAKVSNFHSRLHIRTKPVGKQGWGGGKQGTKDLEILCDNLTLSDPTIPVGHANRDLIAKDNAASEFSTFFLDEEKSARKKIRNIPFLWVRRQTWLPHEHEDDIDIELEAKVAPLRILANQNCFINIANCLLPIFKTLSPPHFLPNLPPFVLPRPGFVTKKVKITANVMGARMVLPANVRDEFAPSLSLCIGIVDKNVSEPFKGIDVSTSFTIDANRGHWAKFEYLIHGLSLVCKEDSTFKSKKNRSSPLLRASGPHIKRSDAPVALKATCWNRLDARRQLSNAPSLDVNVQLPENDVLTVDISASDVQTLNRVIKGYTETSTMTYTQSPFAYCYLTPAKYPLAPPPPKKDFLKHQCFQARINHIQIGIFAGKGRATQVVEAGIRGISVANVSNPQNTLRSELAVGVDGLYARDCRFKGYKIDLIRAGFCDEDVVSVQDKKSSNEVKASTERVEEPQTVGEQEEPEYLQSMFLSMEQVTTKDISEVSCQCGRIAVTASVDSLLEAARIFQPKLGAGENMLPQDILLTEESKTFKLRENVTLSRTKRILADFPTYKSSAQEYVLDGCGHIIDLDYSDKIYFQHDLSKKGDSDKMKNESDAGKDSESRNRAMHLAERELQFSPRVIIGPNRRLIIKNCRIICPDKEMFDLCIRMASGGSYIVDPESVQFLSRQEVMLEKKKVIRRQRTLGNADGDSFSESSVQKFHISRLTDKEMKYLMDSWRGRVKTVVAILRELRTKPGYSISAKKRVEGTRIVIGLKGNDKLGDVLLEVQKDAILKVVDKQRKKTALKCILKFHSIDLAVFPSRDPDEGLCLSFSLRSKINIFESNVESSFELEHMCVSFPDSARLSPLVEPCKITATLESDEYYRETEVGDNSLEVSAPRRETSVDVVISPIGVEISPAAAGRVIRLAQRVSSIVATQTLLPCNHFALVYSAFEGSEYVADFGSSAADFFNTGDLVPQGNALAVAATGAKSTSFSIWRPRPVMGYCSLGDVPNFGPESPTRSATSIRDSITYCSPPSGFKRVNAFKKSDASSVSNLVLWQPIPRKGYRALGLIAAYEEDGEPDPSCVRCVRETLLSESTGSLSRLFSMSDEGNEINNCKDEVRNSQRRKQSKILDMDFEKTIQKRDNQGNYTSKSGDLVHIWAVDSPTGIHMVSSVGKALAPNVTIDPPTSILDIRMPLGLAIETQENIQARKLENKRTRRLLKKEIAHDRAMTLEDEDDEGNIADIKLCVVTAVEFEKVWSAGEMLTGFRPLPPPGFASLGDVVVDGVAHPSMTRCVEDLEYVCAKPVDYKLVFQSTKRQLQAAFWLPVPPSEDYVSCGLVSTSSANVKPSLDLVRCLSKTHCEAVSPIDVTSLTKESSLIIINDSKNDTREMCMWRVPGGFGTFCMSKADLPNDIYRGPVLFVLPSISSLDFSEEGSRMTSFAYEKPKSILKFSASLDLVTLTVAAPQRIVANDADATDDTPVDVEESSYQNNGGIMHQNVPVFAISLTRTELVSNYVIGDVASVGIDASLGAAHLNWRKYAWEPLVSPQWAFGANLVPIKHGECCFNTGNYGSIQATKLCITLTTDFALDMVSIAVETKKEIMRKRGHFGIDVQEEIQLEHQTSIAYPDNDGIPVAASRVQSELEVATKKNFPEGSSALSEPLEERQMLIKQMQNRSKSRDSVLRCFSNTGLSTHATLSSFNEDVENEVIRMKNDTGRTLYTVSRKSLQRGKEEDVRIIPPHGNFDINFCITKETSDARQQVVNANTADVRVAPPLEFLTAKMMVEIIDVEDPMELTRNDVNRSSGVPETYSRISCVLKTSLNMANQRSTAMSSRSHSYTSKVPMRSADYGDESRVSLPLNAKSGYITMDVPHPASASRAFQSCRLRVDLERPCSTHDFVEDLNARSSAEGSFTQNLALLLGNEKPAWVDLLDENEIPTNVRILIRASIFHNISVKVPIHINRHGRLDIVKNAGESNVIFKRMLSTSSALSAFQNYDSDSETSDATSESSKEGTVADFDDDEFEELKNFTSEDKVYSRLGKKQYERSTEDSKSLLLSDNYCNITKTYEFKLLWWSKGTGAKYECSAWIPVSKINSNEGSLHGPSEEEESIVEIPFGCIVVPGFSAPNAGGYLARMIIDDHVTRKMPRAGAPFAHPVGYELLWKDEKKNSVSFWAPVPPEGYVALGRIVMANNGKSKMQNQPSKKSFCCVREDFARERGAIGPGAIWKPRGTNKMYGNSEAQVPIIYNSGSIASGGWTIRQTSKRTRSGEPLEVQTKEHAKSQALTKNFELNFLSGRIRVKYSDVSSNLKVSKFSTNDISPLKNRKNEEVLDSEDTLIAFSKNGPYAAIKASGTDFFERKDQNVGCDKVTVDPRLGALMSSATFVNETSESFSMTLVNLKNAAMNSKVEGRTSVSHSTKNPISVSEERNDLNGSFEENYDPDDPTYRYVWESERHFPPFGWKSPRDILDACFTARYSLNIDGSNSTNHFPEGDSLLLPKGFYWVGEWEIDRPPGNGTVSNTGGWAYDAYWVTSWPPSEFKNIKNWKRRFASTRRRRWRRKIAPIEEVNETTNVSRSSSLREGGASSTSETEERHDEDKSQSNLLLTPRMNRKKSTNKRQGRTVKDSKAGYSWSIEVPQSGGTACIPVGFENTEHHAIRFVPVSKEKQGVQSFTRYEIDEIQSDKMRACDILCESLRKRWESVVSRDNNIALSTDEEHGNNEPDVICTADNHFYLVYMERQKRGDKNKRALSQNIQVVLRVPLVLRNSLPCEAKYVVYCEGRPSAYGIMKPGEEAFVSDSIDPRQEISCAYGVRSSGGQKQSERWNMSEPMPISAYADGTTRVCMLLKNLDVNSGAQECRLEAKLLVTASKYSDVLKKDGNVVSRNADNRAVSSIAEDVAENIDIHEEKSSPSNISAMFVDIRADVIVHNACPFSISLSTEPDDETNLMQISKIEEVVDNRVGLSRVVKRPVNELSEVDPGQINVSFRAGQKLNVDAAVRATVGVVDEVLKNIQKAFVAEISSQVHSLFLAEEVDELENDSTNKRVRCILNRGVRPGEAPCLVTLRTKAYGEVRIKIVAEHFHPVRSQSQNWWSHEIMSRTIKITIVPEVVLVNISHIPLIVERISDDDNLEDEQKADQYNSAMTIPIGAAPVLPGSSSPEHARLMFYDASETNNGDIYSCKSFSAEIRMNLLRESGEQLLAVPRSVTKYYDSKVSSSLIRVRLQTAQFAGSTQIIIGSAAKSDRPAESGIRIENHTRMAVDFSRILLKGESNAQKRHNFDNEGEVPAMKLMRAKKNIADGTLSRTEKRSFGNKPSSLYDESNFGEGVRVLPRSASLWRGPRLSNVRSEPNLSGGQKSSDDFLLPKIGKSVRVVRLLCSTDENVEEMYFELPERGTFRDASIGHSRTSSGNSSPGEEFSALGSITLAEGVICDDPSGKYEICYRLSCIFFHGAETGAEETMSLRLTEFKVEMDPDSQERRISDASPRFAKQPTVFDTDSKDAVLSAHDADAAASIITGHFMSRLVKRNKRKGIGRMNDFEADLKAFQRIQNITKTSREIHIGAIFDGVQISLVDSRREVCLFTMNGIEASFGKHCDNGRGLYAKFAIVSAQLDNMLENALYPVTMFNDAKSGCLLAASFSMRETGEINRFPEVRIVWAPSGLNVLIHEPLLWALKEYVDEIGIQRLFAEDGGDASEMSSSKDSRMKNNDGKKVQSKAKKQKTVSTNLDRLVSVGTLTTDGIRAYVTLTSAPLSRPKNAPMMVCATLNLLRLDRLPIAIAPFSLPTNATLKLSDLRKKMKSHVIRQFTVQSGRILASVDNAGTVSVGLRRAQDKLAELSGDTTKNTVSSREKGATTSVSAGVKNIGQTYVDGTVNLVGGALSGVAGVFYKPVEGFRQEGLRGAAIGGFKGVTGLVTRTLGGAVGLVETAFSGISQAMSVGGILGKSMGSLEATRARKPLALRGDGIIRAYDEEQAAGADLLRVAAKNIVYVEEIQLGKGSQKKKMKMRENKITKTAKANKNATKTVIVNEKIPFTFGRFELLHPLADVSDVIICLTDTHLVWIEQYEMNPTATRFLRWHEIASIYISSSLNKKTVCVQVGVCDALREENKVKKADFGFTSSLLTVVKKGMKSKGKTNHNDFRGSNILCSFESSEDANRILAQMRSLWEQGVTDRRERFGFQTSPLIQH